MVELLIVLAIISVLIGLLFPTLRKARAAAALVACQSNLRQVGVAVRSYGMDFDEKWPDPLTTGNYGFRMRPGHVSQGEQGALPEVYGLAAVLHGIRPGDDLSKGLPPKPKYLPGNSDVWVCPSQTDFMQSLGNTYSFSIASGLAQWNETLRIKRVDDVYVWDNWTQYPGLSGFRGPFQGYTIPQDQRTFPHRWSGQGRGAVCELKIGGHVEVRWIR
jgi:type II secretory pathway pseudopilin PulG